MTYKIHSSKYFGVKPKPVAKEFIHLDKQMQIGYGLLNNNNGKKAIIVWAKVLEEIKDYMKLNNIKSLDKFDKIFNGNENVENWIQDYEMALDNVISDGKSKSDQTYARQRIKLLEFIIKVTKPGDLTYLNSQKALGETYFILRDLEKGKEVYLNLIKNYPNFVWGYIGYSDEFWLNHKDDKDYEKAASILRQALTIENLEDKDAAKERLVALNFKVRQRS